MKTSFSHEYLINIFVRTKWEILPLRDDIIFLTNFFDNFNIQGARIQACD